MSKVAEAATKCSSSEEDDELDDDEAFRNYYDPDLEMQDTVSLKDFDVEAFEYELLRVEEVERLLNESVEAVCKAIHVSHMSTSNPNFNFKISATSEIFKKICTKNFS